MVLPGHRYGSRAATARRSAITPAPVEFFAGLSSPAATAPVSPPAILVVDVRSARQAAWVRQWTSPEVFRAARGRVGRPLDLRAVAARKLAPP